MSTNGSKLLKEQPTIPKNVIRKLKKHTSSRTCSQTTSPHQDQKDLCTEDDWHLHRVPNKLSLENPPAAIESTKRTPDRILFEYVLLLQLQPTSTSS